MSMNDPISDMLTRIRNGLKARKETILCPSSKILKNILDLLVREGFIKSFSVRSVRTGINELSIELKYFDGNPAIKLLKRISTPGRRVYAAVQNLPRIYNGLGIALISTSKGIMTDAEARSQNLGGEVLCYVY